MSEPKGPFQLPGGKVPNRSKPQYRVTEESVKGESAQNQQIKDVGNQLRPEGFDHLGSIAIHIYKSSFNSNVLVKTQNLTADASPTEANWALQQASVTVAKSYGWTPPATRQDVFEKEAKDSEEIK